MSYYGFLLHLFKCPLEVGSGGTKFFRPDPDPVQTGRNPSRSRLNPFFANLPEIFFKQMLNEIPLDSIACHYGFSTEM